MHILWICDTASVLLFIYLLSVRIEYRIKI